MQKYAKIINTETKQCDVGLGNNTAYYQSIGMTQMDVEQSWENKWYVSGYAPAPTEEEQRQRRQQAYTIEVDPITAHINRLRDEEQTAEVIAEIEALKVERTAKVEEIKQRYPYPVGS